MTLKDLVSLENYVPTIYKGVKEIDALIKSEDYLLDILISILDKARSIYGNIIVHSCVYIVKPYRKF